MGVALAFASGSGLAQTYRVTDLGTLGGDFSRGVALNDSGQVTGASMRSDGYVNDFLWDGTQMLELGNLGGERSGGRAINDSGLVTGSSGRSGVEDLLETSGTVYLWDGTQMLDLGTLGGLVSVGLAINASGQVTGVAQPADGSEHAFLWDGTTMLDLNALIDPADPLQPFVTLAQGVDINNRGQILAHGVDSRRSDSRSELRAYLVSPVSAPALTLPPPTADPSGGGGGAFDAIMALGLLGLGLTRRRAN